MIDPENKAYKLFLTYFTDAEFGSAWMKKHEQNLDVGKASLVNDGYMHYARVRLEGKLCSFYGMPSNVSIAGSGGEEDVTVQWITENPDWTWENQVDPQQTFHRKGESWHRKI